jgi:hypothetical protein
VNVFTITLNTTPELEATFLYGLLRSAKSAGGPLDRASANRASTARACLIAARARGEEPFPHGQVKFTVADATSAYPPIQLVVEGGTGLTLPEMVCTC